MAYFVYFLLEPASKRLLYIGRSDQPKARKREFERRTGLVVEFGAFKRFSNFSAACAAEVAAILKHRPPYNKQAASSPGTHGMMLPASEQHRANVSKAKRGKKRAPFSEEWKAKISATQKGRVMTIAHREALRAAAFRRTRRINGSFV